MRFAAIDIATNSIHMIVVRVRPDLSFEVVDREKEMVRLGAGRLDERRLVKHINKEIGGYLETIAEKRFDRVIGTSGTILSLGALALSEEGLVRDEALRNRRVSAKAIRRLRKRLSGADLEARLHMDGLDPRRADIAVAGAALLDSVLRRLGAEDL